MSCFGGRCRASYTSDFPKIECIPKDVMTGVKKAPECSQQWNYGTKPDSTNGVINWGDLGHGCKCSGESQTVSVHTGEGGTTYATDMWRCPT